MEQPEEREDPPIESPPEGSSCAEHSDRPALVICPRCGSFACLSCWHGALKRCHACVVRQPPPPVPWEDPSRNLISRFFGTLGDAGSPVLTAPSFRKDGTGRALVFFLLTFVPLASLAGIVPYTARLLFGPALTIQLVGEPTDAEIAMDVARAAGVGLAVSIAQWLALAVPFASLSNAFAEKGHPDAPMRAMLYRGWLLALFFVAQYVLPIVLPESAGLFFGTVLSLVPFVLLLGAMRATTRMGSGVGALTALLTIGVPFALMIGSTFFLERGVRAVVPELDRIEEAQRVEQDRLEAQQSTGSSGTPSASTPSSTPSAGTPSEGAPSEGTPSAGTPSEGTPSEGTPSEGTPSEGTPSEGAPSEGTPSEGTPSEGSENTPSEANVPSGAAVVAPVTDGPAPTATP
jgi:hypothetical protein